MYYLFMYHVTKTTIKLSNCLSHAFLALVPNESTIFGYRSSHTKPTYTWVTFISYKGWLDQKWGDLTQVWIGLVWLDQAPCFHTYLEVWFRYQLFTAYFCFCQWFTFTSFCQCFTFTSYHLLITCRMHYCYLATTHVQGFFVKWCFLFS